MGEFVEETIAREELRRVLGKIQDLERLLSKVTLETANARDLLALKQSLRHLPLIRNTSARLRASRLANSTSGWTNSPTSTNCSRNPFIPSRRCC